MQIFNLYKFCNLKQNFLLYVVFVVCPYMVVVLMKKRRLVTSL